MDSTTKVIDPYGDVLAILPTTSAKLQISSKVLSTASPVFRSMFSPRFREGAALTSATGLTEIEFPDDSPEALETIFNVLHFRHNCVGEDFDRDVLYEIALVVDKYDLTRALRPWKEGFRDGCRRAVLQDRGEGYDVDEYSEYLGGDGGDVGEGESGWGCDALPEKIVELIHATRVSAIQSLLSVAEHFRSLYLGPGIKCKVHAKNLFVARNPKVFTCDAAILGSLLRHEAALGIFPVPSPPYGGFSVERLAAMMKGLYCFVDVAAGHGGCTISGQVIEMVDEVLAGVDRLDVSDWAGGGGGAPLHAC
ncbi:hypothetical protein C7212DRAFT_185241 [Tuber magnatum]|uniref:BTB domain-containing protein n=1 Tax=Tuber magnatum TaxID=42249 RepID=A0A317SS97_9PEZI|nr:hypothetical protein C7212DRAFT_185241 [Tuber magnatum]